MHYAEFLLGFACCLFFAAPSQAVFLHAKLPTPVKVVKVSSCDSAQNALDSAALGTHVALEPGTYNCDLTMNRNGVVLRSREFLNATLTGKVEITGSDNYLFGFKIHGHDTGVKLGGVGNRIFRNSFEGWPKHAITMIAGRDGRVGYNEFSNPCPWSTCAGGNYPLRIAIRTAEKDPNSFHFNARIFRNYFHDFPTKPNPDDYHSGQDDAMEVCQTLRPATATLQTGWRIQYNLIARHMQGHGVIDLKCGGNIVRYNTMIDSPGGRIDSRNGHYNTIASNWMEGTGGMTILGRGHKYVGNQITRGGVINVMAANGEWNVTQEQKPRAYETILIGNNAALKVGHAYEGDILPAYNTRVEGHQGNIAYGNHIGTQVVNNTSMKIKPAVKLIPSQVGPRAP